MMNIGLLYSLNDSFALNRSELLVGSAILHEVELIRFTPNQIGSDLKVNGERFEKGSWCRCEVIGIDVVMDYTKPLSKRLPNEKELLKKRPHLHRVDLNAYEVLELLSHQKEFKNIIPSIESLTTFDALKQSISKYKTVVLKPKVLNADKAVMVINYENKKWEIQSGFETKIFNSQQMQKMIKTLKETYYVQEYIPSLSKFDRSIAFNAVVQQRFDGAWKAPTIRGAIANGNVIASLKAGAEFIGTPLLMEDMPYFDYPSKSKGGKYANLKLQKLSICIAQKLQEHFGKPIGALGIKMVFDANLQPKILKVDTRTGAQNGPGRHLEFYKHLILQMKNLVNPIYQPIIKPMALKKVVKQLPFYGIGFRGIMVDDLINIVINEEFEWLDMSIGHGGRHLIQQVTKESQQPFLSLKLGNALSNRVNNYRVSIVALEDYLGKGLLNYLESEHMRSIRIDLLQRQLEQSALALNKHVPDMLILEEADLGIRGVEKSQWQEQLTQTIEWFEEQCNRGVTNSWALSLFNAKSSISKSLLELIMQLKGSNSHLKAIAVRMKSLDKPMIEWLQSTGLEVIIYSEDITPQQLEDEKLTRVSLLNIFSNSNQVINTFKKNKGAV